jgi:hypothetical protein
MHEMHTQVTADASRRAAAREPERPAVGPRISRGVAPYRAGMSSKKVAPKVKLVAVIAPLPTSLRRTPAK